MSKLRAILSLATALTSGACVANALDGLDGTRDASVAFDAGACTPVFEARTLSVEDTGWPGWNGLVVDAGKLLMRVASGAREPRVIYRDLVTSSERIEAEGVDAFVLGGREGAFVLAGGGDRYEIWWGRHVSTMQVQVEALGDDDARPDLTVSFEGGVPQRVSANGAAYHIGGDLRWWRDGILAVLPFGQVGSVAVTDDRLFYALRGRAGTSLVMVREPNDPMETLVSGAEIITHIVATGDQVFYLAGASFMHLDLATRRVVTLDEGPCGPPSSSGGRAVAACSDTGELYPALGTHLTYFDGERTQRRVDDEGFYFAPRLVGTRVAWVHYPTAETPCMGSLDPVTEVRVADLSRAEAPTVVGRTGAPCLCCGRLWAPVELGFDGAYVAFNYAGSPAVEHAVEVVRLDSECR
ncbi:MAG: hypothetical protein RIT81_20155 [Deltaproteobacteria bacterium]